MSSYRASPLRYPGGKSAILPLVREIIVANSLRSCGYAEPYAGGAGLALGLLFDGVVSDIYINDIDAGIHAFWYSVLNDTAQLLKRIATVDITLDEWNRQRSVLDAHDPEPPELGFATFFLNRTNRSGIISGAGPIGGFDQTGPYKIDCRFNRESLSERVRRIAGYADCIHLSNLDAEDFMSSVCGWPGETIFFCIDPPYFKKGSKLYTSFYRPEDHASVANTIRNLEDPWIVTYDNVAEIRELYSGHKQLSFNIKYSVQSKRTGHEVLITSKQLKIPLIDRFGL